MPLFEPAFLKLSETPMVGKLTGAYLRGNAAVTPFFRYPMGDDSIQEIINNRKTTFPVDRTMLVNVLQEQYSELEKVGETIHEKVKSNVDALAMENCFTVTTGHQLQVAGGPLFFTYKVLSAIKVAQHASQLFPESHTVPLLWLASEDHDIEEISHFSCLGKHYSWATEYDGPAGKADTKGLEAVINQLIVDLSGKSNVEEVKQLLFNVYTAGRSLSLATRILVNRMFGKYGVVVLDPDQDTLKTKMKKVFRHELMEECTASLVQKCIDSFPSGFEAQATPRELNLFYLSPNGRFRIQHQNENWTVLGTSKVFTATEMLEELDNHPENFSPNVLLRPVYQEMILPNLTYIGGPAEIAYWLELVELFKHFSVNFPMLLVRNSFLVMDTVTSERLKKFGVTVDDIFTDKDALIKNWLTSSSEGKDAFVAAKQNIESAFSLLEKTMENADPTLGPSVQAECQKTKKAIEQLQEKWLRAVKRKNETGINQFHKAYDKLFPGGDFQERHDSVWDFFIRFGTGILDVWLENCQPYNDRLTILREVAGSGITSPPKLPS